MIKKNKILLRKRKYIKDSKLPNLEKILIFNNTVSFFFNKLVTVFMNHGLKKKIRNIFLKIFQTFNLIFSFSTNHLLFLLINRLKISFNEKYFYINRKSKFPLPQICSQEKSLCIGILWLKQLLLSKQQKKRSFVLKFIIELLDFLRFRGKLHLKKTIFYDNLFDSLMENKRFKFILFKTFNTNLITQKYHLQKKIYG